MSSADKLPVELQPPTTNLEGKVVWPGTWQTGMERAIVRRHLETLKKEDDPELFAAAAQVSASWFCDEADLRFYRAAALWDHGKLAVSLVHKVKAYAGKLHQHYKDVFGQQTYREQLEEASIPVYALALQEVHVEHAAPEDPGFTEQQPLFPIYEPSTEEDEDLDLG